jgi:signal transduction histidine kinase
VQDDGKGFEPFGGAGLGILGMEERILRLGGTMKVDSQPGAGTIISFELPVAHRIDAGQLTRPLRTA